MLTGKGVARAGKGVVKQEEDIIIQIISIILKHFNFKTRFIGVYLRDNLPRIKDGAYVSSI